VKGQLTVLLPQADVNYNLLSGGVYMFPRRDGILLGGTWDRGNWDLEPDMEAQERIVARHRELFARV
jgi:D-amino-acid oxidase